MACPAVVRISLCVFQIAEDVVGVALNSEPFTDVLLATHLDQINPFCCKEKKKKKKTVRVVCF